ncbi:MAG: hypothetical protein DMF78_18630 [Acidobacteria bacterium]|nr:MAG: hypothetical protein DMF78_18630 [Acidobacteriota bacterium]
MSTTVTTERFAEASPRSRARMAGFFWLMTMLTGAFAMFAGGRPVVPGDAAATAANILAQEAAFFSVLGCAIGAISFVLDLAPLVVLGGAQYLSVFAMEQLRALAYMFLRLRVQASMVGFFFFGLHCLLVGCLILRSTFLPRIVGALMTFAGLGWLTFSLANLLSPPLGRSLSGYLVLPGALGEGSLTLWLLAMGVNAERWREQARAAGQLR